MTKQELEAAIAESDRKWLKSEAAILRRRRYLAQQHLELTLELMKQKP